MFQFDSPAFFNNTLSWLGSTDNSRSGSAAADCPVEKQTIMCCEILYIKTLGSMLLASAIFFF